jgi:hypothetical protein
MKWGSGKRDAVDLNVKTPTENLIKKKDMVRLQNTGMTSTMAAADLIGHIW